MTLENDHELKSVASVSREDANYGENCEMMQLKTQLGELMEQVAALTAVQSMKRVSRAPCCFSCQRLGHFQCQCPNQCTYQAQAADNRLCFRCGQIGHVQRECQMQGNEQGQGGPQASPTIGPDITTSNLITVAAVRTNAAVVTGLLGGVAMEMMLDSGSAVSLVRKDMISPQMMNIVQVPLPPVKLVTAAGDDLVIVDHIQTTIQLQHHTVTHIFVVVNTLITPTILGIDFYSNMA